MSKLTFSITANQATFVSHQFNGRERKTATLLSKVSFYIRRAWWRFPPTSSPPLAASFENGENMENDTQLPPSRNLELVVQELETELLIYDLRTSRALCLNKTASTIWKGCGERVTFSEMRRRLERELSAAVENDVIELALSELENFDLLDGETKSNFLNKKISRREVFRKYAFAAAALPVIVTLIVPKASQAASCVPVGGNCTSSSMCCGSPGNECISNTCVPV